MNPKTRNQLLYKAAYDYLLELLPEGFNEMDLQRYFVGTRKDFDSLEDVFEQLIKSAQNYQGMPKAIKFAERKEKVKVILFSYDFDKIEKLGVEELYQIFREEFNVVSSDTKYNSWYKWSKSIIDAAKFINKFDDVDDFRSFVKLIDDRPILRKALPLLISSDISGVGFALSCDFLKELGYFGYAKPDVHLIDVFNELGISNNDQISVFEAVVKMAEDCKEIDETITPYKIDKIIWLICSGRLYLDGKTMGRHKKELITRMTRAIGGRYE